MGNDCSIATVIIDAGPLIIDGENVNSRLWALIKRATERGEDLHTTRQANLARAARHFNVHSLDNSVPVGRRLAAADTSDVVDAHLTVVAESIGTFILTTDPADLTMLGARFETY